MLWKGSWFIQEKSCNILTLIIRYLNYKSLHSDSVVRITQRLNIDLMYLTLANIVCHISARLKAYDAAIPNGDTSDSKKKLTTSEEVLRGLVDWLCAQVRK